MFINGLVSESSEAPIEQDWEDENETAVGKGTNQTHKCIKVRDGAGNNAHNDGDENTEAETDAEFTNLAETFDCNVEHILNVERKGCRQERGG